MNIENSGFHNWITIELNTISFLLDLSTENKNLSLSLINKFISTFEFQTSISDIEELNLLLQELRTILDENDSSEKILLDLKHDLEKLQQGNLEKEIDELLKNIQQQQFNIQQIQLKLFSYTPKLLNYINTKIPEENHATLKQIDPFLSTPISLNIDKNHISTSTNNHLNHSSEKMEKENICKNNEEEKEQVYKNKKGNLDENVDSGLTNKVDDKLDKKVDTLIISEQTGKIILPYTKKVLDINQFKNSSIARFREAFYLMKNKEHSDLAKSFSLAFELMFRYDLHPAVISACRNIDELDIYISCLDHNLLNEFPFFEIKFEIPPRIINNNRK